MTGSLSAPGTLLLGRFDISGDLRLVARSTTTRRVIAEELMPAGASHPWHGRHFSACWGTRAPLAFEPVQPDLVVEFDADTAVDAGRYRHPVRILRPRHDLSPDQVPRFPA
ncbi:hypothetical protein ACXZ65_13730 [Streptomyces aculeolatus]